MISARMTFCRDDIGMWQWLITRSQQSLLRSHESFSTLDLCRQDARRILSALIASAIVADPLMESPESTPNN